MNTTTTNPKENNPMTDTQSVVDLDAELDDAEYADLIRREMQGDDTARAYLEQDLDSWMHGLQQIIQDVQAQFSRRNADDAAFRAECFRGGPEGRKAWFERAAQTDQWRGAANGFLKHAAARLREVKLMRHDANVAATAAAEVDRGNVVALLREAITRLDRIEAALGLASAQGGAS